MIIEALPDGGWYVDITPNLRIISQHYSRTNDWRAETFLFDYTLQRRFRLASRFLEYSEAMRKYDTLKWFL